MKKTNYNITIGYKAVTSVNVKATNEEEAKKEALEIFKFNKDKMFKSSLILEDESFKADGCLNMDETWNMF